MTPWRGWYHCMGNTYGTWLPGDARGWRSRHHREHVEGDYKHPPSEDYSGLHEASQQKMKRPAVILSAQQREAACLAFGEALLHHGVELVELAVGAKHFHVLARFTSCAQSPPSPDGGCGGDLGNGEKGDAVLGGKKQATAGEHPPSGEGGLGGGHDALWERPRWVIGKAKSWSSRQLVRQGLFTAGSGGVWADGCKVKPIRDREHQLRVVTYIRDHVKEGAAVWSVLRARV